MDWREYVHGYHVREAKRNAAIQETSALLFDRAKHAAQRLREDYGVERVYLFGSVVNAHFSDQSDLDMAVSGLSSADYFGAWRMVSDVLQWEVDVIRTEEAKPRLLRRILEEGVEI